MGRASLRDRRASRGPGGGNRPWGLTGEWKLTAEKEKLTLRAAEATGCPVAGVDLLSGPGGEWYVIEVNAVPGWRALAAATGVDIAKDVVRFVEASE